MYSFDIGGQCGFFEISKETRAGMERLTYAK